ncbi:VOC family protein [Croceibacterium aestuarii]|uniref:VOC family protein n=1 Tax=Croceibacterium aestuarii TaxID=3064139 RepID=UPI00272ECD92|nr:VOC family protein [Croceibacterium sp. D39]
MTAKLPNRLHHTAYVTKDLEATRHFYEDILGFPLVATWCEQEELFGKQRTYCHCFFGLGDGSALAFFQFAHDDDQAQFGPEIPSSPFIHIALNVDKETQDELEKRIKDNNLEATYVLEHGYCRSVYVVDPNGMIVEFTHDAPHVEQINEMRKKDAHSELKRWLAGDHTPNNDVRPSTLEAA